MTIDDDLVQFMDKNDKQKGKIAALREEINQLMVRELYSRSDFVKKEAEVWTNDKLPLLLTNEMHSMLSVNDCTH